MMNTAVAKKLRDLGHVLIPLSDEFLGFLYFQRDPIIHRAGAGGLLKNAAQIGAADGKVFAQKWQ